MFYLTGRPSCSTYALDGSWSTTITTDARKWISVTYFTPVARSFRSLTPVWLTLLVYTPKAAVNKTTCSTDTQLIWQHKPHRIACTKELKVNHIHKCPPTVTLLCQINLLHILPFRCLICLFVTFWFLTLRTCQVTCQIQKLKDHLLSAVRDCYPAHLDDK